MFACELCNKSFQTKMSRHNHKVMVHIKPKKKCHLCNNFFTVSNFKKHYKVCLKNKEILVALEKGSECQFGCGKKAKYKLKNGKLCCSKHSNSCFSVRQNISQALKKRSSGEKENTTDLESVAEKLGSSNLPSSKFARQDILNKKDQIIKWVSELKSKRFLCEQLKCKHSTLNTHLKNLGIDYKGNRGGRFSNRSRKNIYDYLKKDFSIGSSKLKIMLFKERVKEEKCENCNNFMWMGQKIPLELHHIDDDKFNNLLENLKILCSNCHSLVTKRFKRIQT